MRTQLPPFLVFEGLDGTGKTTLAREVARTLGAVSLSSPPAAVRPFREAADEAFPRASASATLFYAACVQRVAEEVEAYRVEGLPVVLDRYWLSTRAYAHVLGVDLALVEVERRLPRPTMTVYTTAPLEVRARRLAERGMSPHDRDSLRPEIAARLDTSYRGLLRRHIAGRVLALDTSTLPVNALAARVREALDETTRRRLSAA